MLIAKYHTKRNRNKKSNPCPTASNPNTTNALDLKLSYSFFTFGMSHAYLSTNLVTTLASLDMYDLTHLGFTISVSVNAHFQSTSHKDARSQSERPWSAAGSPNGFFKLQTQRPCCILIGQF
jgi:hypothetical protein